MPKTPLSPQKDSNLLGSMIHYTKPDLLNLQWCTFYIP